MGNLLALVMLAREYRLLGKADGGRVKYAS